MREILRDLHKNGRKGFTLAELLIVIAITGILASFGFVEVTKYQRKLKRVEMDNIAREIFVAAQNHLTASKVSGNWTAGFDNGNSVTINTANAWQQKITSQVSDYPTDSKWDDHTYYYVIYNSKDYSASLENSKSALTQLLPYGSVDDTVRISGSYVIEFDSSTASVYGVFYTDNEEITASDIQNLDGVRTDDTAREQFLFHDETKAAVGYYGGAVAIKNETSRLKEPIVQIFNDGLDTSGKAPAENIVINSNALEAVITDPNYTSSMKTTLTVTMKQRTGTGTTLPSLSFDIKYDNSKLTISNILPTGSAVGIENVVSSKLLSGGGIEYHISLDDITAANKQFASLFPTLTPGADIQVDAKISYSGKAPVYDAKIANSLFDSIINVNADNALNTSQTGYYSANIRSARHLQNLLQKTSSNKVTYTLLSATLLNDINWYNTYTADFEPLYNNTLRFFDGKNYKLTNFNVDNEDVNNKSGNGGLFAYIGGTDMTVKDLDLVDFNVIASNSAGTLFGELNKNAVINNIHVYNSLTDTYGSAADTGKYGVKSTGFCAGGLIGTIDSNPTVTIENSSASVRVEAPEDAGKYLSSGGFIGYINGTSGSVTIDQCYAGGNTSTATANITGYYAGGFVCFTTDIPTTITNCYTTATVNGVNSSGGFVGYVYGSSDSLNVENVFAENAVSGSNKVGRFAGRVKVGGGLNITGTSYVQDGISDAEIIGENSNYVTNADSISLQYSAGLKALANAGAGDAAPYTSSLGTSFPYPATISTTDNIAITHYGDWVITTEPQGVTLTKNIHFASQLTDSDDEQVLLQTIREYTGFLLVDDKKSQKYFPLDDSNVSVTQTPDGYALNIPIDSYINKNRKYTIYEYNNPALEDIFASYSDSYTNGYYAGSYFNTQYTILQQNPNGQYVGGNTTPTEDTYTYQFKANNNWTVAVTFDNYYQVNGAGTLYYEVYTNNTHYMHGYYGTTEVGLSTGFPSDSTTTVKDYGYLYVIPDAEYDYVKELYSVSDPTPYLWLDFSKTNGLVKGEYYSWSAAYEKKSLSYYLSNRQLLDVSSTDFTDSLGLTKCHVYKLNFSGIFNNQVPDFYDNMKAYPDYTWICGGFDYSLWFGLYKVNLYHSDGAYAMNPYYADTVTIPTVSSYNPFTYYGITFLTPFPPTPQKTLDPLIRASGQLDQIIKNNGLIACYNWNGKTTGDGIRQALNLDMSAYNYSAQNVLIGRMYGATYEGIMFPGTEANPVYPTLSGLNAPLFGDITKTSKIQNLNVNVGMKNVTVTSSSTVSYGLFVTQNFGTISNVTFTGDISNCVFGSPSSTINGFGIIAYDQGGSLQNIQFANVNVTNTTVYATDIGLLGDLEADAAHGSLSFDNVTFSNDTLIGTGSATNAGLIGYMHGLSLTNTTFKNIVWKNNNIKTDYSGLIGTFANVKCSKITASNVHMYNDAGSANTISGTSFGLIANTDNYSAIDGMTVSKPTDQNYGFAMENLNLNTSNWGMISQNAGKITNSSFNDIVITGINSSNAISTVTTATEFSYGVVGKNSGSITDFDLQRVQITKNIYPAAVTNKPVCVGVFGFNFNGTINNTGKTTRVIDTVTINNNSVKTTGTAFVNYGFIGRNTAQSASASSVSDLTITNYISGGYGFVYQNENAWVHNVTLGSAAAPAGLAKQYFAAVNNSGVIGNCYLYATGAKQICETSKNGLVDTCYVNGTKVTK